MDIFDASDYDFVLPRRAKRVIAWALLIGVAWVPSVRGWYFEQAQRHAKHVSRELISRIFPSAPGTTTPAPTKTVPETQAS